MSGSTRVTAVDPATGESETTEIRDNYVLICDGTANRAGVTVRRKRDGTETHVITVKGIRQRGGA